MAWQERDRRVPPPPLRSAPARPGGRAALSAPLRAATATPSRLPRPRPSGLLAVVVAGSGGARMGRVPETPVEAAARRRRQVVATLRLAEAEARYAADQVGNGLDPLAARWATLSAAGELVALARVLRRLTRPVPAAERRRQERVGRTRKLRSEGLSVREIAARLGVTHPTVLRDLGRRDSTAGDC